MIDLRKLEVFVKVYETGSFSRASRELFLAQPTITLHIKSLEEQLGIPLFDRHTRRVIPTKAGRILYRYGREILFLLKNLESELEAFRDFKKSSLEIGGSTIPGQYLLPGLIKRFKEVFPEVSVYLKVGDSKEIVERVGKGELEIGIVGALFKNSDLEYVPWYEDKIVFIAPPDFEEETIFPEYLYKLPVVKREEGSGTWKIVRETLQEKGLQIEKLKVCGELGSTEAIKEAVKAGLGFGFVSAFAIENEKKLGLLKEVKIKGVEIKRKFYLVWLKNKRFTPVLEDFINFLKSV